MPEFDALVQIAHKKERTASRRLARLAAMPEHEALVQTLRASAAAASVTLDAFIDARRSEQAKAREVLRRRNEQRENARAMRERRRTLLAPDAWHAWFDGSAHPNPGKIGIGGLLRGPANEIVEISAMEGYGDSCKAEYLALIAVLGAALEHKPQKLLIQGDSRVVIDDMNADAASRSPLLREFSDHAGELLDALKRSGEIHLKWIPRARNSLADALSQRAVRGEPLHAASRTSVTGLSPNESLSA